MTRHLHGHHIQHWANGGHTALENIVHLCQHHHRLVHEGGYDVHCNNSAQMGNQFIFTRANGSVVEATVPQYKIKTCAETLLKQHSEQRGLSIDANTAMSNWDGEAMDRGMAVDAMFSANEDFQKQWQDVSAET